MEFKDIKGEIMFYCDCNGHGLKVERFDGDDLVYVSLWQRAPNEKMSFIQRINGAVMFLFKGNNIVDDLVFTLETARELGKELSLASQPEEQHKEPVGFCH